MYRLRLLRSINTTDGQISHKRMKQEGKMDFISALFIGRGTIKLWGKLKQIQKR